MIVLADRTFADKTKAKAYFKAMLGRYRPGERVSDGDQVYLAALLRCHPYAAKKIGAGVGYFDVRRNGNTHGFWLIRSDGTETDFSYPKCIDGAASPKLTLAHALRHLVSTDVRAARAKLFLDADADGRIPCAVTGKLLTVGEGHMDHQPPMLFDVIVAQFLINEGVTPKDVEIVSGEDGQTIPKIADLALADRFRNYHNRVAKLAFVEARVNLSMGSRLRHSSQEGIQS